MRKLASVLGAIGWPLLLIAGFLLLVAAPVVRMVALASALGLEALAVFYVVEGVVVLLRAVFPLRGWAWFKAKDAQTPDITIYAMGLELAVSMIATLILIATAAIWQPLVHVQVAPWLIGFIALRLAGSHTLYSMVVLRRPLAFVLIFFDLAVNVPLVALANRTLSGTVVISAFITWIFVLAIAWMPAMAKLPKEKDPDPENEADRWKFGSWISGIEESARRPLLAAVGGLAIMVPGIAAILLNGMLLVPFLTIARHKPSNEPGMRAMRGIIAAGFAVLSIYAFGPAIFRAIYPASFGDGAALHQLAFTGLALLPMALRIEPVTASQTRVGLANAIALVVLVVLALTRGVDGVWWGIASSMIVCSSLGKTDKSSTDPVIAI